MRKIVVIGGTGAMGRHVVRGLLESGRSCELVATGRRNLQSLREFLKRVAPEAERGVALCRMDIGDSVALDQVLRGAHLVINCSGPYRRLAGQVLTAVINAGAHYMDLADEVDAIEHLLSYNSLAEERGVAAVLGMGWTPGLTNLAAKAAGERVQARSVRVYWAGSAADDPGHAVIEHVLHVVTHNTWQFVNGERVVRRALDGRVTVDFPAPYGAREAFYVAHPEPVTIPRYLPGVQNVEVRGVILPAVVDSLIGLLGRLGIAEDDRKKYLAASVVRRMLPVINLIGRREAVKTSAFRVETDGIRYGREVRVTYWAKDTMARLTAMPCVICALMLTDGEIQRPGVHPPEGVVPARRLFDELARRGLVIQEGESDIKGIETLQPKTAMLVHSGA